MEVVQIYDIGNWPFLNSLSFEGMENKTSSILVEAFQFLETEEFQNDFALCNG